MDAATARELRLSSGFAVPLVIIIDAMPVFGAVTSLLINPADKSLACHVQFLREFLDRLVSRLLIWFNTRDTHAD